MVRGVRPALRGLRGDRRAASYATAAALSTPTAILTAALAAALAANAVLGVASFVTEPFFGMGWRVL